MLVIKHGERVVAGAIEQVITMHIHDDIKIIIIMHIQEGNKLGRPDSSLFMISNRIMGFTQ